MPFQRGFQRFINFDQVFTQPDVPKPLKKFCFVPPPCRHFAPFITTMVNFVSKWSLCRGYSGMQANFPVSGLALKDEKGLSDRETQVLKLFDTANAFTRKDVEQAVGISQATAIILLRGMLNKCMKTGEAPL